MHPLILSRGGSPRVVFEGSWEAYLASRSANLRSVVRRGEKRLREHGALVLEEHRGGAGLDAAFDEFLAVEASGWKGADGTAIAVEPGLRERYLRLAREAAARDQFRLYLLRLGPTVIAGDYGILFEDTYFMLKTGYAQALAKASPGNVLHQRVLARLWSSGTVRTYDFMLGDHHADYKRQWANDVRRYATIRLFHPRSVRGRLLARLVRLKHARDAS